MNRKPSYAGSFYTIKSLELNQELDNYFSLCEKAEANNCIGVISPHAGFVYSGKTAAVSYNHISKNHYKRAVIIAPVHRYFNKPFSVGDYQKLETPIGDYEVDREIVEILLEDPAFRFNENADKAEHSLEVQLPFLLKVHPDLKIVPILFSQQNLENAKYLLEKLTEVLGKSIDETLFIISSDFSHYHSAQTAERMDKETINLICKLETEQLFKALATQKSEACGFGGILFMMELAKQSCIKSGKLLQYSHSGMVNFDNQSVVGYASIAFEKE